jgi:hypothetical protein
MQYGFYFRYLKEQRKKRAILFKLHLCVPISISFKMVNAKVFLGGKNRSPMPDTNSLLLVLRMEMIRGINACSIQDNALTFS